MILFIINYIGMGFFQTSTINHLFGKEQVTLWSH